MNPTDPTFAVTTRAEFVAFVRGLREDLRASLAAEATSPSSPYGPAHGGWENPTLDRFLEALAAYADDAAVSEPPTWRTFAEFLAAAKVYE